MAMRIMTLRGVPDDELDEICSLFDENKIAYYVTPPGNWYISAGAIWIEEETQRQKVFDLLNAYQQQRQQQARGELEARHKLGEQTGIVSRIIENPLRFIAYLIVIGFILYISVMPFMDFGK